MEGCNSEQKQELNAKKGQKVKNPPKQSNQIARGNKKTNKKSMYKYLRNAMRHYKLLSSIMMKCSLGSKK